jgi:hypothetical protein
VGWGGGIPRYRRVVSLSARVPRATFDHHVDRYWCCMVRIKTGQVHRKHLAVCHITGISTYRRVRKELLLLVPNNQNACVEMLPGVASSCGQELDTTDFRCKVPLRGSHIQNMYSNSH